MTAVRFGFACAVLLASLGGVGAAGDAAPGASILANPELAVSGADGVPDGWSRYGQLPLRRQDNAFYLLDDDEEAEAGVKQRFDVPGPGRYELTVHAALPDAEAAADGAFVQLRLIPGQAFCQRPIKAGPPGRYRTTRVGIEVPEGVKTLEAYLYTHRRPTPRVLVRKVGFAKVGRFSDETPAGFVNGALADPGPDNVPAGWLAYGQAPIGRRDGRVYLLDPGAHVETGIRQRFAAPGPGKYEMTVYCSRPDEEADAAGAFAQLRLLPQGTYRQRPVKAGEPGEFRPTRVGIEVPDGVEELEAYIYTHRAPTPRVLLEKVEFGRVDRFTPEADDVLTPDIPELKALHLTTPLAGDDAALLAVGGHPAARAAAARIATAWETATGAAPERIDPAAVALPLTRHVVAVGAREDNDLIRRLYGLGFCYTDAVYPGPGGHELRTLHNPTGGGFNVVIVGGSDAEGLDAAAGAFSRAVGETGPTLGHLMRIKAPGFESYPHAALAPERFHSQMGSGIPFGYGWNHLAARMALFYQTGDERYAKDFLRLAFPDAEGAEELKRFNAESFDDPRRPLAAPYHYMGHRMILLWDLIEEHPVFSDADRLAVTRALAAQLDHPGIGGMAYAAKPKDGRVAASRHHQWADICLYVLARYFARDYPHPTWSRALARARSGFEPTHRTDGWIEGERGIVPWFLSGSVNPAAQFYALAGDARHDPDDAWSNALAFFETQWDGTAKSEILGSAGRELFYLAAEHARDGKYLHYADLLPAFGPTRRLGPSFRPDGRIAKRAPAELLDRWTAAPMKRGEREYFGLDAPAGQLYLGLSWRDALDASGDFLAFNCFNEEYRTPYKLLSLSGFRLDGTPVLAGFGNFVQIYRRGATEAHIPTVGRVYGFGNAGDTVHFSGGVPDMAHAEWRRDLLLRRRRFLLLADTIAPRGRDNAPVTCRINFQTASGIAEAGDGRLALYRDERILPASACRASGDRDFDITVGPNATLFKTGRVGDRAALRFTLEQPFAGRLRLTLMQHDTRAGRLAVHLDGERIRDGVAHFVGGGGFPVERVDLGARSLAAGEHTLELEVTETAAATAWVGVMGLGFLPDGAGRVSLAVGGAEVLRTADDGAAARRDLPADPERRFTTFTLVANDTREHPVSVTPIGDRIAALRLPEAAVAFAGDQSPYGEAELALLERERVSGHGGVAVADGFRASKPVAFDWDLITGAARFSGAPGTEIVFADGRREVLAGSPCVLTHVPDPRRLAAYRSRIEQAAPPAGAAAVRAEEQPASVPLRLLRRFPQTVSLIVPATIGDKDRLLAAYGETVELLDPAGRVEATFRVDAPVTACAYFPAAGAVVVGDRGDGVTAFGLEGGVRWRFTSRLAPEIEATQKYYWFKGSYPGVYSLAADGNRLYVGGACTMEAVGADGALLARYPQPWGPARQIAAIAAPDGSRNVVGLRHTSADNNALWYVNTRTGANRLGFNANLPGFKNFPAFGSLYRTKALVADFDGDGREELFADSQGLYLWVNVYDGDGRIKYQTNLGPGEKAMGKAFIDMAAGDLSGDACPEVVLVGADRELLALDGRARPRWRAGLPFGNGRVAIRPASAPGVGDAEVWVVGEGGFAVLSGEGKRLRFGTAGTPLRQATVARDRQVRLWSDDAVWALD